MLIICDLHRVHSKHTNTLIRYYIPGKYCTIHDIHVCSRSVCKKKQQHRRHRHIHSPIAALINFTILSVLYTQSERLFKFLSLFLKSNKKTEQTNKHSHCRRGGKKRHRRKICHWIEAKKSNTYIRHYRPMAITINYSELFAALLSTNSPQ